MSIGGEIHGQIICSKCGNLIMRCKCIEHSDNIQHDICGSCKGEPQLEPHWEMLKTMRKRKGK